jgi:Gluconate 2-dehydrogenase subunit 3
VVALISDLILPATDTPGAIEAAVPQFIELMVADWYTDTERRVFFEGLDALEAFCAKSFSRGFASCAAHQQTLALQDAERLATDYAAARRATGATTNSEATDETAPLFAKIKALTVLGYYTSEVGVTQELSYQPVPGRYEGNYLFSKVGKQWAF